MFIDLDFSHIHMINAYKLEMHTGTAEINCRREGLILHGIEAPYLHPRIKLHLPPVLVSRVIKGLSPLNLLEVVSLKKKKKISLH